MPMNTQPTTPRITDIPQEALINFAFTVFENLIPASTQPPEYNAGVIHSLVADLRKHIDIHSEGLTCPYKTGTVQHASWCDGIAKGQELYRQILSTQ